jgi:hypothetical protein
VVVLCCVVALPYVALLAAGEEDMSVTTQIETSKAWNLATRPQFCTREFNRNASIVLIGSRGSGKRSLGFIGATHLGRRLITEDHYFLEATGVSR